MKLTFFLTCLTVAALTGCTRTPQAGDTTPPYVTMSEVTQGLPVIASTAPEASVVPMTCNGVGRLQAPFDDYDTSFYHVLAPGQREVEILISFFDASGIDSAQVIFGDGSWEVLSPDVVRFERRLPSGSVSSYLNWDYNRGSGDLVSPVLQTFELRLEGRDIFTGRWIQFRGRDGVGNNIVNTLLWIVSHDTACLPRR